MEVTQQPKEFAPVTITLNSEDEVSCLYANLTSPMETLNATDRDFAYQLSELIRMKTNVFDFIAP